MCKTTIFTQLGWWPRIVLLLLASHLSFITSSAQTFTTQVQQQKKVEGKVTITQSHNVILTVILRGNGNLGGNKPASFR